MTVYLSTADVVQLHADEVGPEAIPGVYLDKLDSAVHRCQATAGGLDLFPSLDEKAAALFLGLARGHGFVDGNKRIAVLATYVFYSLNGHLLLAAPEDVIDLTISTLEGTLISEDTPSHLRAETEIATVASYFKEWAQPMDFGAVDADVEYVDDPEPESQ